MRTPSRDLDESSQFGGDLRKLRLEWGMSQGREEASEGAWVSLLPLWAPVTQLCWGGFKRQYWLISELPHWGVRQLGYLFTNSCPVLVEGYSWKLCLPGLTRERAKCPPVAEKELRSRETRFWSKKAEECMRTVTTPQVARGMGWWGEGRTLVCMKCNHNIQRD